MDEEFINDYFNELNSQLKNKHFSSKFKEEFDDIDSEKLKDLIEEYL